jgi:hypothetical protein
MERVTPMGSVPASLGWVAVRGTRAGSGAVQRTAGECLDDEAAPVHHLGFDTPGKQGAD